MTMKNRGYKYRVNPTEAQRETLRRYFGAVRYTYNWALRRKKDHWAEHKEAIQDKEMKTLSKGELVKEFQVWKQKPGCQWLTEPLANTLNRAINDVFVAYKNWFRRLKNGEKGGPPKFKSKRASHQSFYLHNRSLRLQGENPDVKVYHNRHSQYVEYDGPYDGVRLHYGTIGPLKIVWHRPLPVGSKILSGTLSKNNLDEYYVSFSLEVPAGNEVELDDPNSISEEDILAFDLGLTHFLTLNDGTKINNPRYMVRSQEKVAIEQRRLSRKVGSKKGERKSKRWRQQKKKMSKVQAKVARQRKDFVHNLSADLVAQALEEGKKVIAAENLDIQAMMKSKRHSRSIADASWAIFKNALAYKCEEAGVHFVLVPKWFPSSKLCATCGYKNSRLTLKDRRWKCASCGGTHDRDVNAAKNIQRSAYVMLQNDLATEASKEVLEKVLDTYQEAS